MSATAPDVDGFIAAQARLRSALGSLVTFKVPTTPTWPEGTKINAITGLPYDSIVKPENAAFTEVVKRCLIILKQASPLRPQPDTETTALGEGTGMDIIIDVAIEDYSEVEEATELTAQGLDYKVVEVKPYSLDDAKYRYLFYGLQL